MAIPRRTFIKNTAIGAAGIGYASLFGESLFAMSPASALPHSVPEAEGITSASILQFISAAEKAKLGLHSLMVIRNGKIVAQGWWDPYKPDLRHMLFSLSKSFTSTAIGFAVSERRLTVEDKVTKFFPEDLPETISPFLQNMQVKHLLTMTSGHDKDTAPLMRRSDQTWVKTFLSLPIQHAPGTFFLYNSGATYMLSAIITKLTGKTVLDYLTPRLFKPLEIEGADWEVSPQGINNGYAGLRVKTEDIAKLGILYLQNGIWNGKRVLNADWVKEATTYKVPNAAAKGKDENSDWQQGYCYQFWRCRHDFFRGDGAMGQYCLVSRDLNTVIAITSETANMQTVLDAVWDNLLPGIKTGTLPLDGANQSALKQKLASLTLLPQKTGLGQAIQTQISGKNYTIQNNNLNIKQASLSFNKNSYNLILNNDQTIYKVIGGLDNWINGETSLPGAPPNFAYGNKDSIPTKVAAAGVWVDDKTFVMTLQYFETPYGDTITCRFENNNLRVEFLSSRAAKGGSAESRPVLAGTV
jgi:CubicO group peptidase (beta-lactamase class C family)